MMDDQSGFPSMVDIAAPHIGVENVEITIRKDGSVIWINADAFCVFRMCRIPGKIVIIDERETDHGK